MKKNNKFRSCLREYDIRGIVGETLNTQDGWHIGRAFGSVVKRNGGNTIVVAYDGRLSSPKLLESFEAGALESGIHIQHAGRGPTPMLYYSAVKLGSDGGVMITGSHNPPHYNGFKIVLEGHPFFGEQIQALGDMIEKEDYIPPQKGKIEDVKWVKEDYVKRLLEEKKYITSDFKIVWDAGNGAAGEVVEDLTSSLSGENITLNMTIDGHFPNHHPDPTVPENLKQLIEKVRQEKADIGFAFDGDADRLGVVDEKGQILFGDEILLFLARDLLQTEKGATIISDVKASQLLFDGIKEAGGKPLMWRTGHSLIKTKMAETGSPLAGEMSGHIFYANRWYGFDDAIYVALRFLECLSHFKKPLSEFKKSLPHMEHTPELRFPCDDDKKFLIIENIADKLRHENVDLCEIDGVRVNTSDGWWLLRASNTQSVLVARAESTTKEGLASLKKQIVHYLESQKIDIPIKI